VSQVRALSRQLPVLYFVILLNTWAVALTTSPAVPWLLNYAFPALMSVICTGRAISWVAKARTQLTTAQARRQLNFTAVAGTLIGIVMLAWALSLYNYADIEGRGYLRFYIAVNFLCCVVCLKHDTKAVISLALAIVPAFVTFLLVQNDPIAVPVALNIALVCAAMVHVMLMGARDHARMIAARNDLIAKTFEAKKLSDDNLRLAERDSLTGVANRRSFFAEMNRLLGERRSGMDTYFAVGLFDLDGFKPVNDVYGHIVGDTVLSESAQRLVDESEGIAMIARLGGDQFGIIVYNEIREERLLEFGRLLCDALRVPFTLPGVMAQLSGSVGFALANTPDDSAPVLFERADYALAHAKKYKRGQPVIFSASHQTEIQNLSLTEQCLLQANLDAELALVDQPIVSVEGKSTTTFEALARWSSPILGPVRPDLFIQVAERSDLINRITLVLLRKAIMQLKMWPDHLRISFNLSMKDISSPETVLMVIEAIATSGIDPSRLDLEVTETVIMSDFEQTLQALRALKALGVGLSLDDFGIGYSSLSYLHKLPIDKLKIDRSFITEIETSDDGRKIVRTIVDLCHSLGLRCVVEGVETAEQAAILEDLGCHYMQGYHFGRPLAPAQLKIAEAQSQRVA
jgi:diguanylate cyclase (GGDEF)-like protein